MRPLRLEMAAFGPFADTEIIDFSNLGENPLFLINGPTGAGKTTILDAICYALYGQTTGNEREGKQMRCSDAESDLLTSVDFVFALGNRTFRILRSPDQKRPKSRGDGFTEQKATANLYEVKPDKDHLIEGPKVTLVNNKISELTGLSADQFRQVMVLPQGKFRELLIASSDSREAIFEQLFQTHVYSALQSKLKLEANQLKSQIRELESNQRGLLTAQDLENAEALTQAIANLNREQVNLNKQKAIADREYADAQTLLQAAHTLDQAFQALIEAQKRKREILAQQPQVDQSRERCRLADQARDIHATFAQLSAQKTEYKTAQQRLEQQQKHLTRVQEDYDSLNKEHELLPQKEKSLSELVQQITDLTGFRTKALLLTDAESKANQTNNKLKQAQVTLDSLTTDRNTAQTQLEQLQVEIEQLRQAQVQLPEKRALLTTIKNEGTIIRQITELKNSLVEAKQDIEQLQKEEKVSHQTLENRKNEKQQLEKIWRTGQAAKLAAGLTNNLPCPVCGSADHPSPAVSNDAIPTDEQLEHANSAIESAHKQWDTIRSRLDVKQTTHQGLEEQFKVIVDDNRGLENETLDAVKQRYRQTNTLVEGLQKQVERLTAKNADLENTSASIKQLDADLKAANQALNQLTSASAAAATELESQRSAVPEAYRDLHELEKTLSETTKNKEKLESEINSIKTRYQNSRDQKVAAESELKSATVNEKEANKKREQLQTTWESILNESPFDNEQHFINASMERAEQNRLQEEIQRFDNDLLLATNQVTDKENATLEKKRPDLQLLQENEQKALQSKELVQQQVSQTQLKLESLNNTKKQFLDFVDQQTALETQYGTVGRLSDVSNGNNSNNLNLQRFVLSVLLDDVLQEANVRLQKMSQGRYRLYRSEEVEDRRSKAGLDLIVDDTHTGEPRAVTTLSGGESFQAALALALGLSDVVQAYAGGIRLDTLFIDEGFGSLDATSLDLAINTLLDLQKTGRMVGVISHVQEMKQMLSVRLDVNSDRGRSHTQWVGV